MRIVKTGLYCLIGIACAMLLLEFFIPSEPDRQTWPEQLLLQRQALLAQEEEAHWLNRLAQAGENKSEIEQTARDAIVAGNYLSAYKASALLDAEQREHALTALFVAASRDCDSLGWALAALQELPSSSKGALSQTLLAKWEECQGSRK